MTTPTVALHWRISSFSGGDSSCVEIANAVHGVHVRNSNHRDAGTLVVDPGVMAAWTAGAKAGDLDDLAH